MRLSGIQDGMAGRLRLMFWTASADCSTAEGWPLAFSKRESISSAAPASVSAHKNFSPINSAIASSSWTTAISCFEIAVSSS